jgi:hypothetical protein
MDAVYGDYKKLPESEVARVIEDEYEDGGVVTPIPVEESSDSEEEEEFVSEDQLVEADGDSDDESEDKSDEEVIEPPEPKVARELSKLSAFYNSGESLSKTRSGRKFDESSDSDSDSESERDDDQLSDVAALVMERLAEPMLNSCFLEKVEFGLNVIELEKYRGMDPDKIPPSLYRDLFTAPSTFEEAWNHPVEWLRKMWREAIMKELQKMNNHEVWKIIKRSAIPKGRRCVKHKWIFEIKRNGVFRARLVACGYSQIPGVDFTVSHSPVVNDVTVRLLLILLIMRKYKAIIVDVETAFLHGILGEGEEIYMDCPKGMVHLEDECLLLVKTIYGLVQSARAYNKKCTAVFLEVGFVQSAADPCLFV